MNTMTKQQKEWNESQNDYSIISRKLASPKQSYNYYKDHHRNTYIIGRYRYTINGEISIENVDKKLETDGIEGDKEAYYWHYFHNSCSFINDIDFSAFPEMKSNRFMVKKINSGEWNFNHNAYACVVRILAEIKLKIKSNQSIVVYLPTSKQLDKKVQDKYFTKFIDLLKEEHLTYVIGNIDKIKETSKQLIVFVIDIITSISRQNAIIQTIRNKRSAQLPVVSYYSLLKIHDKENTKFALELKRLRRKQQEEKKAKEREVLPIIPAYDEEELIMRALSGRGADPEIFGF